MLRSNCFNDIADGMIADTPVGNTLYLLKTELNVLKYNFTRLDHTKRERAGRGEQEPLTINNLSRWCRLLFETGLVLLIAFPNQVATPNYSTKCQLDIMHFISKQRPSDPRFLLKVTAFFFFF